MELRWDDKEDILETRKNNSMVKSLHPEFMWKTDKVRSQKTWKWVETRTLKKETENVNGRNNTKTKQYFFLTFFFISKILRLSASNITKYLYHLIVYDFIIW